MRAVARPSRTVALSKPVTREERNQLELAMRYIRKNYRQSPDLFELADVSGFSAFHFHRRFTKCFGRTPKQVLSELQVEEAKRLMRKGTPLVQIAKVAGFTHQSHLSVRFRQLTGYTPSRWIRAERHARLNGVRRVKAA